MYFCTVHTYFWRARLRSDARRVREPDHGVSPPQISGYERSVRSQKGSHVRSIPCPFVPRRNYTEGHGDPRKDPMSVQSPVRSFPEGIPRKVTAILGGIHDRSGIPRKVTLIPEGIPCPSNPMSVRSHVHPIPSGHKESGHKESGHKELG
jgi:hypothetical protein